MQMTHPTLWRSGLVWSPPLLSYLHPAITPGTLPSCLQSQGHAPYSLITTSSPSSLLDKELHWHCPSSEWRTTAPNRRNSLSAFFCHFPVYPTYIPWSPTSVILFVPCSFSSTWEKGKFHHRSPCLGSVKMQCVLSQLVLTAGADNELWVT